MVTLVGVCYRCVVTLPLVKLCSFVGGFVILLGVSVCGFCFGLYWFVYVVV